MNNIDEIAAMIGKIVINFNALELSVRRLVWFMVDGENPAKGQAETKALQVAGVIKLGFRLLKVIPLERDVRDRVKKVHKEVSVIRNERNEVAHTYFRIKNNANDLSEIYTAWPQHYKKGAFFSNNAPLDGEKLKDLNARCIEAGDSVSKLLVEIGAGVDFGKV